MAKKRIGKIFTYLFLICLALIFLVPVFYVFYNSLLPKRYIGTFVSPDIWSFDNYKELFTEFPIFRWYANTAISTVTVVAGNIFFTPLAGYALARLRFPGRKTIFLCLMHTRGAGGGGAHRRPWALRHLFPHSPAHIRGAAGHHRHLQLHRHLEFLSGAVHVHKLRG